jgi:surface antigen
MKRSHIVLATVLAGTLAVGCTNTPVNKETAGTGIGAATGALLGYGLGKGHSDKTAAIVVGGFLGGVIGNRIGARLNEADRAIANDSLGYALENNRTGVATEWHNPDTGHRGYTTPNRTYAQADGSPCREFTTVVNIGGSHEQAYGTACRQQDGSWKIVN